MSDLRVVIGYDPRQPVAYQVCAHSVWEHAAKPVSITRLDLRTLPITRRGLTEFTYSRFLVPYLSNFEGYSLFLDSDILVRGDVHELFEIANGDDATSTWLWYIDHQGKRAFERSSVMLFHNEVWRTKLTPEFVENPENKMFDFKWAIRIDTLPKEWNHLVGYDAPNPDAKIVHYTMGIPIYKETAHCEFAKEWQDTFKRMNSSVSFEALMGPSVHIPHLGNLATK